MSTTLWPTFFGNFPGDGTTPLNQNTLNLYTIPEGSRIRRTLLHMQLSCQIESATPMVAPLDFVPRVVMAAGLWLGDTVGHAANSPSVLDDANSAQWLLWDSLQERVDTDAIADTGLCRIVWETPSQGLDIQTRRNAVTGIDNDLWLGWQVADPEAVINGSNASYNGYLSGWYSIRFLIEMP